MIDWDKVMAYLFFWFMGLIVVIFMLLVFLYIPIGLKTDAECLRAGYPKSAVTVGLERYCLTLDGMVTVKVDKAGK